MMRIFFFFCCAAILFLCCKEDKPHMTQAQLAPILADLHVADAYSSLVRDTLNRAAGKNYDSLAKWTAQIFARHKVTVQDFTQSMDWYRDHPVALDSLYAAVVPILEKQKK